MPGCGVPVLRVEVSVCGYTAVIPRPLIIVRCVRARPGIREAVKLSFNPAGD